MFDEFVAYFRNMDETVLMNAYIDKGAEIDDIAHHAVENHAGSKIGHIKYIGAKLGSGQRITYIASRLFQLLYYVGDGGLAYAYLVRELLHAVGFRRFSYSGDTGGGVLCRIAEFLQDFLCLVV